MKSILKVRHTVIPWFNEKQTFCITEKILKAVRAAPNHPTFPGYATTCDAVRYNCRHDLEFILAFGVEDG